MMVKIQYPEYSIQRGTTEDSAPKQYHFALHCDNCKPRTDSHLVCKDSQSVVGLSHDTQKFVSYINFKTVDRAEVWEFLYNTRSIIALLLTRHVHPTRSRLGRKVQHSNFKNVNLGRVLQFVVEHGPFTTVTGTKQLKDSSLQSFCGVLNTCRLK
ncbi:hypothetical protein BDF20DRAFT_838229 [Mycotypha africana]|uniref:uncharacterized protein n=1 Tax=Mycotypha africana TaxID=64632 RepID=UPI00230093CD|nr:uncharacterized protein BDF20DRAFT_838229 [Mycotypha africana]KAI8971958.1 hypothetical protein BDF20DRAFT_838229 [Mycotypha africana]